MSSDLTLTGLQGDFIARKLMLMEARLALTEARIKELEDNRCRCGERANATFSRPIDITASGVFLREIVAEAPAEPASAATFSRPIEITASGVFLREIEMPQIVPQNFGLYIVFPYKRTDRTRTFAAICPKEYSDVTSTQNNLNKDKSNGREFCLITSLKGLLITVTKGYAYFPTSSTPQAHEIGSNLWYDADFFIPGIEIEMAVDDCDPNQLVPPLYTYTGYYVNTSELIAARNLGIHYVIAHDKDGVPCAQYPESDVKELTLSFSREIVAEAPAEPTNEASFSRPIGITASGKSLRPLAITASGKFARVVEAK